MDDTAFCIRRAEASDETLLWEALFHAAHMPADGATSPEEAQRDAFLVHYVSGWGKPGDIGCVAFTAATDAFAGAAWMRCLPHTSADNADAPIPELAIAVLPAYHNQGLGTRLLTTVLGEARSTYNIVELSVRATNPARRLYERHGFVVVKEITNRIGGSSLLMQRDLTNQ